MKIRLIQVPYDSGNRGLRLGAGPEYLASHGLLDRLSAGSRPLQVDAIEADGSFTMENQTSFELMRKVAGCVAQADREGEFPIVLAGNCDVIVGSVSGLMPRRLGVIWFDAHSDFRTPERTFDGFLDGMGLAILAGLCWRWATATVPGFRPVPAERLLHVGSRPLREEIAWLNDAGVAHLPAGEIHEKGVEPALSRCLAELARHVDQIHLHLDLDVLDPSIAPANTYSRAGGLTPEQVGQAIDLIAARFRIAALDLTAYDPACDPDARLVPIALDLAERVIALRAAQA